MNSMAKPMRDSMSSSSASNSNNSAKRPHWHQGNFIENSQDMSSQFRREREERERREREERERREREKERETENRKRQEQEQRRRNAETFIQSTNTNPVPQKHLFSEPVQRHDEAKEDEFAVQMSEKIFGKYTSSRQMVLSKPRPNEFFEIQSIETLTPETRPVDSGNLFDNLNSFNRKQIEVGTVSSQVKPPVETTVHRTENVLKRSSSPARRDAKRLKLKIPKNDSMIEEIIEQVKVPDLLLPIETPKKDETHRFSYPNLKSEMLQPSFNFAANEEIKFKAKVDAAKPKVNTSSVNTAMAKVNGHPARINGHLQRNNNSLGHHVGPVDHHTSPDDMDLVDSPADLVDHHMDQVDHHFDLEYAKPAGADNDSLKSSNSPSAAISNSDSEHSDDDESDKLSNSPKNSASASERISSGDSSSEDEDEKKEVTVDTNEVAIETNQVTSETNEATSRNYCWRLDRFVDKERSNNVLPNLTVQTSIESSSNLQKNVVKSARKSESPADKDIEELEKLCHPPVLLSPIITPLFAPEKPSLGRTKPSKSSRVPEKEQESTFKDLGPLGRATDSLERIKEKKPSKSKVPDDMKEPLTMTSPQTRERQSKEGDNSMSQSRKLSEKLVDEKDHKKMKNFKEVSTHKSSKVKEEKSNVSVTTSGKEEDPKSSNSRTTSDKKVHVVTKISKTDKPVDDSSRKLNKLDKKESPVLDHDDRSSRSEKESSAQKAGQNHRSVLENRTSERKENSNKVSEKTEAAKIHHRSKSSSSKDAAEKNKDQKLASKSVPEGNDQVKSSHSNTENEVPNQKKDERHKNNKEFSASKDDKNRRSSSEKEDKKEKMHLSSKENGSHRSKSSREDLAKQEKKNKPEVSTADVKSPDISEALNATPRVLLKLNKVKSTTVPVESVIQVQKEASLKLKLSREKYLKAKEREGKEDVAPERLDQKIVPEPFSGDKEKQPLKELNQTVDTPSKKASSSVDAPVVPLSAEKKRKQDGQAGTPDSSKKKRKSENEEKIVQPVRIEISEPVVEISTESVKQPEFVPPVSMELKPTVTQSASATQSTCAAESASSLAAELSPAPLIPSAELPSNAGSKGYIVRKKKNVVPDPAPVKDSASSNTSAINNNSEAVTLDSRRNKFDSSESRSNVCSLMEMDANSLYKHARSLKHTGDKLKGNMFQRILHYADAAVLYLAHIVKTGPKLEHLLKDTVTFCTVFQQIRQQQSYMEKDKLDKLQAISLMILSLIHFNIYQFNYKRSLHSRLKASLTSHRVKKTSSPARAATGADLAPQAAVGSNPSPMSISPRPSPSSVTSAGSTSSSNGDSAKPATGAVSSSTPSAANGTEHPAPSSSVPHSLLLEVEKYFDTIEHINKAHEMWREAMLLARQPENVDFFSNMDVEYGPLEMTSPINHVMEYITVAIFRLRNLTAS